MAPSTLTVPEGLALLLLRDSDGRRAVEAGTFDALLAAGALAELAVDGAIDLDAGGRVVVAGGARASRAHRLDPTLHRILDEVAACPPQPDEWWVARLAGPALTDGILDALVGRAIVAERPRTFLGHPVAPAYPALRSDEEEALRDALRFSLAVDHHPAPRVVATIALLDVVGRLRHVAGFIPDGGLDLRSGQWPAAALQAWLLGSDPVAGGALRTSIERGDAG
ncbi:GOLPH3/VPS74 family protein [Leifsonia sp. 22587]|uniref:GOLPH3/VPS74 family protein n=1 Tax=Leifsonia sp. 22587 TaxID=3453946 RepID=UPI003F86F9DD